MCGCVNVMAAWSHRKAVLLWPQLLSSNPSHQRGLELSYYHPGDSGALLLSAGLEGPRWRPDTLRYGEDSSKLRKKSISEDSCRSQMKWFEKAAVTHVV